MPALADNQFLVRNLYLSIDPAQRGWVNEDANYANPVAIGDVMRSLAVGVVEESRCSSVEAGEVLYGWFGWQTFCVTDSSAILNRIDTELAPASAFLSVLGINGISAYLALELIGQPQAGETILVSTAAGALGSIAGQIAAIQGCNPVGLTGSDDKVDACQTRFGYRRAINYKTSNNLRNDIAELCPEGIDIFLDNTSGDIADAVVPRMNVGGRVIQCGTAAVPVWFPPPMGPRRDREILTKRLRHEGFVVFDHLAQFPRVIRQLAEWLATGQLTYDEEIEQGLERAPAALEGLYQGENRGKKIIKL